MLRGKELHLLKMCMDDEISFDLEMQQNCLVLWGKSSSILKTWNILELQVS
jgi:hypothetical protein